MLCGRILANSQWQGENDDISSQSNGISNKQIAIHDDKIEQKSGYEIIFQGLTQFERNPLSNEKFSFLSIGDDDQDDGNYDVLFQERVGG